jgi:hypothetical protein
VPELGIAEAVFAPDKDGVRAGTGNWRSFSRRAKAARFSGHASHNRIGLRICTLLLRECEGVMLALGGYGGAPLGLRGDLVSLKKFARTGLDGTTPLVMLVHNSRTRNRATRCVAPTGGIWLPRERYPGGDSRARALRGRGGSPGGGIGTLLGCRVLQDGIAGPWAEGHRARIGECTDGRTDVERSVRA